MYVYNDYMMVIYILTHRGFAKFVRKCHFDISLHNMNLIPKFSFFEIFPFLNVESLNMDFDRNFMHDEENYTLFLVQCVLKL